MTTALRKDAAKIYLDPGAATTCIAGAAIVGKRFVKLNTIGGAGNQPSVVPATAGTTAQLNGFAYGVAHYSVSSGDSVSVLRSGTIEVTAGEDITKGDPIAVGANGVAMKAVAGGSQAETEPFAVSSWASRVVGFATAAIASGQSGPVTLAT